MRTLLHLRELVKKEKINHYLKNLKVSERLQNDDLRRFQYLKLAELLKYIQVYNPFYSRYIKENLIELDKNDFKNMEIVLNKLPVVDKKFIKKNGIFWLTTNNNAVITKATTSGSTGEPFEIYHSSISRDVKASLKFRLLKWHEVNRWEKQFYFGCSFGPPKTKLNKLKIAFNDGFVWNKHVIDFTQISETKLKAVIGRINKEKPVSVWGYPSVVYELANYSLKNNQPITNEKLRMVVLSGESHTVHMKDVIKEAFKVFPSDEYNANEGFIAGTCKYGKLHLMEDTLIAEVLREDGTISQYGHGELLVTYLYSYDFPFIRYKIGDIANISEEKCECGRVFKVISSVDGRKGSIIFNGDEKISNATCNHYITKSQYIDAIDKYQILQNDLTSVIIKLVVSDKNRDFSGFEKLMSGLFDKLSVKFEYVDDIPRQKSGKFIDVLNNVGI